MSDRATTPPDHDSGIEALASAILAGDRATLARAITLIESTREDHQQRAEALLQRMLPATGRGVRLGITGVPGVGKSTVIDQLGLNLIAGGRRVAVLAIDPTSRRTGGSILGDKTRMARLAASEHAFIRPSPTSGTLGGVARRTREAMVLVEAAGFDVVIVETVGVGQSETMVAGMVDMFVVLLLPGGGDELQGIKKGVIELADLIAINKADGDMLARATRTAADYLSALALLSPSSPDWRPPVLTVSGRDNTGLDVLWSQVCRHREIMQRTGELDTRRRRQAVEWMSEMIADRALQAVLGAPDVRQARARVEAEVAAGRLLATIAAGQVLAAAGLGRRA